MKRKSILTLGAIAATLTIGAVAIPAIAGNGQFGPGMMMHGMMDGERCPGKMMRRGGFGGHGPTGMQGMKEHPIYKSFDADADGTVTADEAKVGLAALHAKYDANGDGVLSADEFKVLFAEATGHFAERPFAMLDADSDGQIDAEELAFPAQMMARMQKMHAPASQ